MKLYDEYSSLLVKFGDIAQKIAEVSQTQRMIVETLSKSGKKRINAIRDNNGTLVGVETVEE